MADKFAAKRRAVEATWGSFSNPPLHMGFTDELIGISIVGCNQLVPLADTVCE